MVLKVSVKCNIAKKNLFINLYKRKHFQTKTTYISVWHFWPSDVNYVIDFSTWDSLFMNLRLDTIQMANVKLANHANGWISWKGTTTSDWFHCITSPLRYSKSKIITKATTRQSEFNCIFIKIKTVLIGPEISWNGSHSGSERFSTEYETLLKNSFENRQTISFLIMWKLNWRNMLLILQCGSNQCIHRLTWKIWWGEKNKMMWWERFLAFSLFLSIFSLACWRKWTEYVCFCPEMSRFIFTNQ